MRTNNTERGCYLSPPLHAPVRNGCLVDKSCFGIKIAAAVVWILLILFGCMEIRNILVYRVSEYGERSGTEKLHEMYLPFIIRLYMAIILYYWRKDSSQRKPYLSATTVIVALRSGERHKSLRVGALGRLAVL